MEKIFNDFVLSFSILLWFLEARDGPFNKGFVLFLDVVLFIGFILLLIKYCLKFWHLLEQLFYLYLGKLKKHQKNNKKS